MDLIASEIQFNHYLEEIFIPCKSWAKELSRVLPNNIKLKRFQHRCQGYDQIMIQVYKDKSFQFRMSLAIFLRGAGYHLDDACVRIILEYCIGSN